MMDAPDIMLRSKLTPAEEELESIRAVFQHGADEENWVPGSTLAESVQKLLDFKKKHDQG